MAQIINGIQFFLTNNIWNTAITALHVHANSATYIANIGGLSAPVDPHFDATTTGLPYNLVTNATPTYTMSSFVYASSDAGPYPIPTSPLIENGVDKHYLALNTDTGMLYEMLGLIGGPTVWSASAGAVFDLSSNTLRSLGATTADAAGLPMLPGNINYAEAASGIISHALRATVSSMATSFVWPARLSSGTSGNTFPPAGIRLRLKASFDSSSYSAMNQTILTALKTYGAFAADNSAVTSLRLTGSPDSRWNRPDLLNLNAVKASDFEAVDESNLQVFANSGQSDYPVKFSGFMAHA